ncbi:hypothetical protein Sme01_13120 [Sphaerisporangium melleum]|uniref:Uncharacterized protein n=1 Tax=Sphaerisporangium melleum TaxID=321316 RepID=A0A917QU26_9ACTN|nr:hypothetical protein [Sphaerisporangium melleum]GGK67976.1 hypothetical protein GCM10007964_08720 [Sphaerisporangium melleum]GII68836.1 hypothetical protein Sme01_13120 [Sphaerisporangium melleum]
MKSASIAAERVVSARETVLAGLTDGQIKQMRAIAEVMIADLDRWQDRNR